MSFQRILAPVLVLSFIVTACCFVTYDKLIPVSANRINMIKDRYPSTQYIYTQKNEDSSPKLAVIISRFRKDTMNNVILLDFSNKYYADVHQLSNIYSAKTGKYLGDKWRLNDITQYQINNDGIFTDIKQLKTMDILNGEDAKNAFILMTYSTKKEREITNYNLKIT